jgi:hypothetical protein
MIGKIMGLFFAIAAGSKNPFKVFTPSSAAG